MPQELDTRELDNLTKSWDELLRQFPEKKATMLREMGNEILSRVKQEIGGTGKVKSWQDLHFGSRGGYVAVRPKKETYQTTKSGRRYAVGYITNAIEGGHKPRGNGPDIPGRHFYEHVRNRLDGMGDDNIQELMQLIVDGLEGRL